MALVFQYGSNTSSARINGVDRLNGDAKSCGLVRTIDSFELAFTVWSTRNDCAAADIKPGFGRQIWGVLYVVPDFLMTREDAARVSRKSFDQIEGKSYRRIEIRVQDSENRPIQGPVVTYVVIRPRSGLRTSVGYVKHIISGLREHDTPAEYLDYVKNRAIVNNPDLSTKLDEL